MLFSPAMFRRTMGTANTVRVVYVARELLLYSGFHAPSVWGGGYPWKSRQSPPGRQPSKIFPVYPGGTGHVDRIANVRHISSQQRNTLSRHRTCGPDRNFNIRIRENACVRVTRRGHVVGRPTYPVYGCVQWQYEPSESGSAEPKN